MISFNNGEYCFTEHIKIDVNNLGYNRSFGVFDFMRMEGGVILFLEDYLERFENSQRFLFKSVPYSKTKLKEILSTLIELNNVKESTFKFILSADIINGNITPHFVVLNAPYHKYPSTYFTNGSNLLEVPYVREFSEIKTLNYMTSFQHYEQMKKHKSVDILFHKKDKVSEASRSNVFMIKKGQIFTSKDDILNGITRKVILRDFKGDLKVKIKDIGFKEILAADEVFISSTLKKVMPIVKIGKHKIGNAKVGTITKLAIDRFQQISNDYIMSHK